MRSWLILLALVVACDESDPPSAVLKDPTITVEDKVSLLHEAGYSQEDVASDVDDLAAAPGECSCSGCPEPAGDAPGFDCTDSCSVNACFSCFEELDACFRSHELVSPRDG